MARKVRHSKQHKTRRKFGLKKIRKPRVTRHQHLLVNHGSYPIPRRYMTSLKLKMVGNIPAGANAQSGNALIPANQFPTPFNGAAQAIVSGLQNFGDLAGTNSAITLVGGCSINDAFVGAGIIQAMYGYYRIHGSKLTVRCVPSNVNDSIDLVLCPVNYSGLGNQGSYPIRQDAVSGQPLAKTRLFASGTDMKNLTLSHYMRTRDHLGMSKVQYDTTTGLILTATPSAANSAYWYLQWKTCSGAVSTNTIAIEAELEVFAEFYEPVVRVN